MDTEKSPQEGIAQDVAVVRAGDGVGQPVVVTLVPDDLLVSLKQERKEEKMRPLWHRVQRGESLQLTLRPTDDQIRVLSLSFRSKIPGWKPNWLRWQYAERRAPEHLGGDAVSAQDSLHEGGTRLQLLLLPEDREQGRTVYLECVAELDGETLAGNYSFEIVINDSQGHSVTPSLLTRLCLRHSDSTLLDYLPALFRQPYLETPTYGSFEDKPFFQRYLRGFEDAMQPMQEMLGSMERFFDADETPAELLNWLATWVGLVLDENWPVMRRRRLIKEAAELYRWRGTKHGLSRYLEIYAGVVPEINDRPFEGMRLGTETLLGKNTVLGDVPPHTFVVTLALPNAEAINPRIVREIILSEKPAHTAFTLNIVERSSTTL